MMQFMQKLEIEKNKEEYRGRKASLKRRNKLCKKNQMKPHEYGNPTPEKSLFSGRVMWHEESCRFCNKKKLIFDKKF